MGKVGAEDEATPTLLILKDEQGGLMGGLAPCRWEKRGAFYGNSSAFIFQLAPSLTIHGATGFNSNFQWCGANFSQLPNGVGFGGQVRDSVPGKEACSICYSIQLNALISIHLDIQLLFGVLLLNFLEEIMGLTSLHGLVMRLATFACISMLSATAMSGRYGF